VLPLVVIYPLVFQGVVNTDSPSITDMLIAIAASLVVVLVAEVVKWFERRNQKN
jgi:malic enzyme